MIYESINIEKLIPKINEAINKMFDEGYIPEELEIIFNKVLYLEDNLIKHNQCTTICGLPIIYDFSLSPNVEFLIRKKLIKNDR